MPANNQGTVRRDLRALRLVGCFLRSITSMKAGDDSDGFAGKFSTDLASGCHTLIVLQRGLCDSLVMNLEHPNETDGV